jgi:diacylglycerol kinase (ATP)
VKAKGNTMKIKFIVNPKSKKANVVHLRRILNDRFTDSLVDVEEGVYPRHACIMARQAAENGFDTVVAVGGDGTVNQLLNGIIGTKTALGIVPTGTANDLASYYHIPRDMDEACGLIASRHLQPADVIRVNGWCYVTAGGIGLPAAVAGIANAVKSNGRKGRLIGQLMGSRLYLLAVMGALLKTGRYRNSLSILVDGMLDVCLIENSATLIETLAVIVKVLTGRHIFAKGVKIWQTREVRLQTKRLMDFMGDGEIGQKSKEFKVEILPQALNVITGRSKEN